MYDQRQEPNEFVADTLDEARSNAAKFFEVEVDQLKVVVPKDGEIYGAGGRAGISQPATPRRMEGSGAGPCSEPATSACGGAGQPAPNDGGTSGYAHGDVG